MLHRGCVDGKHHRREQKTGQVSLHT
jgi:hypothetical protein